jgi:M6 family metalloprotease-like protein
MSFGQLKVEATVIPERYTSDWGVNRYRANNDTDWGGFDKFALEILQKADRDLDFSDFDNDGNGEVDFPFIMLPNVPDRFIRAGADGIAQLGFDQSYVSDDESPKGKSKGKLIRVSGRAYRGSIIWERDFRRTANVMIHEFGHGLGLPDLYNIAFQSAPGQPFSNDGAGIGFWGIMGGGTEGWDGFTPSPFSAWPREELGWIGQEDGRLIEVTGDTTSLAVRDVEDGGSVIKVPLQYDFIKSVIVAQEYLLLEMRRQDASPYQEKQPGDGLLIWHVRPQGSRTMAEDDKLIDLVCADGLYADIGFPEGKLAAPLAGHDNLDFWAKDADYRHSHRGNKGDSTDLFDAVNYTRFAPETNPSSTRVVQPQADEATGLVVAMHRDGDAILVDITQPRWAGTITDTVDWVGDIFVDGDLTIAPEGRLVIHSTARVHVAGSDRLRTGLDPERCELRVEGSLEVSSAYLNRFVHPRKRYKAMRPPPAVIMTDSKEDTWLGILSAGSAQLNIKEGSLELHNAIHGLLAPGEFPSTGVGVATAIEEEHEYSAAAADTFGLGGNYPNPFDELTTIRYSIESADDVALVVYNSLGQVVRNLVQDYRFEGSHEVTWDAMDDAGRGVGSGLYLYSLSASERSANGKMMKLQGYAQLLDLEEDLRSSGQRWKAVESQLQPVEVASGAFGFSGRVMPGPVAMTAGRQFVALSGAALGDSKAVRPIARELLQILDLFDGTPQQSRAKASIARIATGAVAMNSEEVARLRRELLSFFAARDHREVVYFNAGEWLQTLKATFLVAQLLDLPLDSRADLEASATIAEYWAEEFEAAGVGGDLTQSLIRLAAALRATSATITQLLVHIAAAAASAHK